MGKWEITVTVVPKHSPVAGSGSRDMTPFDEKYTVEKSTEGEAIKDAVYQASKVDRGRGYKRGPHDFKYKSSRVLEAPSGGPAPQAASSGTDIRAVAENVLGALSNSTEFAGLLAEAKNLEKMVAKLGGAGKVLTGAGIALDLVKYYETFVKMAQTNDQNKKKELMVELLKICGSLLKTTITIAFPPAGIVDAAYSTLTMVNDQMDKVIDQKLQDRANVAARKAMKEKYDKEGNRLKPDQVPGYFYEVALYTVGFSMNDIVERRRYYENTVNLSSKFKNPYKGNPPGFVSIGIKDML